MFVRDAPSREKEVRFILYCVYCGGKEHKDNEVDKKVYNITGSLPADKKGKYIHL